MKLEYVLQYLVVRKYSTSFNNKNIKLHKDLKLMTRF